MLFDDVMLRHYRENGTIRRFDIGIATSALSSSYFALLTFEAIYIEGLQVSWARDLLYFDTVMKRHVKIMTRRDFEPILEYGGNE